MSAARRVAAIVSHMGHGTVDDVAPKLPDLTRQQVQVAMWAASTRGWISAQDAGVRPGFGSGRNPSIYTPANPLPPRPTKRRSKAVSSVWELGTTANHDNRRAA